MAEFEVYVDQDYIDDVYIDFVNFTRKEKAEIIKAILNDAEYKFENIDLHFEGETTVDIEPEYYR